MKIFSESLAVELPETDESYESVRKRFLEGMKDDNVIVVAVHRRNWSEGPLVTARGIGFNVWAKALEVKCNGDHNLKFGWYGSSKKWVERIFDSGFSFRNLIYKGFAVVLAAENFSSLSMERSVPDEDGLRHMLFCKVVLGKYESIPAGTGPSSDEFDSAVDSCDNPKKYLIWGTHINTQILPEFVVTFKVKLPEFRFTVSLIKSDATRTPVSRTIPFPAVIQSLETYLAPDAISLIKEFHEDYREKKIAGQEFVYRTRQVLGDKLFNTIFLSFCRDNSPQLRLNSDRSFPSHGILGKGQPAKTDILQSECGMNSQKQKMPISLSLRRYCSNKKDALRRLTTPNHLYSTIVKALEKCMAPDAISLIRKYQKDHKEKKITFPELNQRLTHIAGVELLKAVAISILRRNRKL